MLEKNPLARQQATFSFTENSLRAISQARVVPRWEGPIRGSILIDHLARDAAFTQ
jgi:hypothetical protein